MWKRRTQCFYLFIDENKYQLIDYKKLKWAESLQNMMRESSSGIKQVNSSLLENVGLGLLASEPWLGWPTL